MRESDARLVALIYDGIVGADSLAPALSLFARHFDCRSASIVSVDPLLPQASLAVVGGAFSEEARRRYNADFAAHDPIPKRKAGEAGGTVFATDRIFSKEYLRRSLFLNEFLRPIGIEETLGSTLSDTDGRFALLTVHRSAERAAFDEEDCARLVDLMPHVKRALQVRRAFARLEAQSTALQQVVDRLSAGVIIYPGSAAPRVNRAASEIVARGDGLWLDRKGGLHARDRTADRAIDSACREVAQGRAGGVIGVPRRDHPSQYAVLVAPLPRQCAPADESAQPGCLVLIHDPDAQFPDMTEEITRIFGMPAGAASLVAALARGDDLKTYASRNALSYDTVRYHIKMAFARTGTHTQGRLLQRVTRAMTEFGTRQ